MITYNMIKQLYRTEEDLITYLRFIGREDLATKFKTQGFLYLSEVLETSIDGNWSDGCEPNLRIDCIDFGKGAP